MRAGPRNRCAPEPSPHAERPVSAPPADEGHGAGQADVPAPPVPESG